MTPLFDAAGGDPRYFFSAVRDTDPDFPWQGFTISEEDDELLVGWVWGSGNDHRVRFDTEDLWASGDRVQFALTWDTTEATTASAYLNGVLQDTRTSALTTGNTASGAAGALMALGGHRWRTGSATDCSSSFNGVFELLYVWDRELSAGEIDDVWDDPYAMWIPAANPAEPAGFFFNPAEAESGQCFTFTAGNGAHAAIDFQYTLNGGSVQTVTDWQMDSNGEGHICTDEQTAVGLFRFINIRNTLDTEWIPILVDFMLLPRRPTFMTISPGVVTQGQCYTMTVGNGADMTIDFQYTKDEEQILTVNGWPTLDENGEIEICTDGGSPDGDYVFTAMRNTLSTEWIPIAATVTIHEP